MINTHNHNNFLEKNLIKQKEKYTIMNFYSCVVAFTMTIFGLILRIIVEFIEENIYVCLTLSIIDLLINFLAIIFMIISWVKLKRIERMIKKNEENNFENK